MSAHPLGSALGRIQPEPAALEPLLVRLGMIEADPDMVLVPTDEDAHPGACMDGRPAKVTEINLPGVCAPAVQGPRARAAGATLGTWVADLLTVEAFRPVDSPSGAGELAGLGELDGESLRELTPAWLSLLCSGLREASCTVSTHNSDRAHGGDCGCGAIDNLGTELALMAQEPHKVAALVEEWGFDPSAIPSQVHERCARYATTVPHGQGVYGIIAGHAQAPVPQLLGAHGEVALVVNRRRGTTVDTQVLEAILTQGDTPCDEGGAAGSPGVGVAEHTVGAQAFVIDAWTFENVADFLHEAGTRAGRPTPSREALAATVAAFNAGVVLTLAGARLPVVVLD